MSDEYEMSYAHPDSVEGLLQRGRGLGAVRALQDPGGSAAFACPGLRADALPVDERRPDNVHLVPVLQPCPLHERHDVHHPIGDADVLAADADTSAAVPAGRKNDDRMIGGHAAGLPLRLVGCTVWRISRVAAIVWGSSGPSPEDAVMPRTIWSSAISFGLVTSLNK
jgi:hypothetical protein